MRIGGYLKGKLPLVLSSSPPPRLLFLTAGGPLLGCAVLYFLLFSTRYPEGRSEAGAGPFGVAQGHGRD